LAFYSRTNGHQPACRASERAAEVFLKGYLFKCPSDGTVITNDFLKLCSPCYRHDDILFGLIVSAEAGHIKDPRCGEDLYLLEADCLPSGGADEQWLLADGLGRHEHETHEPFRDSRRALCSNQ